MPSPEAVSKNHDPASESKGQAPKLRLVKSSASRDLSPLEREFLPPLLEIQETPPSPVKRWVLWSIVGLVVTLIVWATVGKISIVATAPGKFIPDGRVKEVQPLESSMVKAIHVKEGQRVHEGDLLLELDPTLLDTFPFQRYGSLKGTLVSISPDAEDKNAAARDTDTRAGTANAQSADPTHDPAATPNTGYVYKVRIHTEDSHFVVDGEPRPVLSGMTVQADITTDRRRVIDFFLSPVVKYLDEGMKVR